ncbi:MAG: phosphate acyltransferase PlsX [Chloroflexi bacterium]|nr:phosphate acyltransferase PlsX [Chloroflexota bacterium]
MTNFKKTSTPMNIALDVMGGDHGPREIVAGAVAAARAYGVTVTLVGKPDAIQAELARHSIAGLDLPIVPASQVVEMEDKPATAVRTKPDSSMVVACELVRTGKAQAFVTAGNTGGALAAGIFQIGRMKGVLRPALLSPFPTVRGFCAVLDIGANADVRPEYLPQFAIMGTVYAQQVMAIPNPTVRILSNGEEAGKGNQLVMSAYELLEKTPGINFQGNVESKEVVEGLVDVVITDGFTGNIFIKTAEATARLLQKIMREELTRGLISTAGAFLARAALRRVGKRTDDSQFGGAVLLGLSNIVVVAHGRSNATAIQNAIRMAKQGLEYDLLGKIQIKLDQSSQSKSNTIAEAANLHENLS